MFKLVIEDDEGNKTVVPVIRDEISIGRQEGNTIRLTERNVSRRHAKLVRASDNSIVVEELSARYGIRKNGEKIAGKADFAIGDVFLIGDYRLTLQGDAPPEAKPEPPKFNGAPPPASFSKPSGGGFSNQPTQITRTEDLEKRASQGTEIIPAAPAKIVVVSSNFAGQEFPLTNKEMVIGRGDECDIIVDHRSVSQSHAKIVRETSGTYKIVDLNSKNGIKVSGEEYKAVHLKRGDIIELGHVKFRFVEPNENYVFTPQAVIPDDDDIAPPKGGNKNLLIGVLGIAVIGALAVAGYALTQMNSTKSEREEPVAVQAEPAAEDAPKSSVQPQLDKAVEELNQGNADRSIAILELARDTLSPSPEEKSKISDLLSQARREKPLEEALKESRASFEDKRYVDALKRLKSIPPDDSIIYGLLKEEGLVEKSIEQVLAQAEAAHEEGDSEEAMGLVEEVLLFDSENQAAAALRSKIETAKPAEPVAVAQKTSPSNAVKRPPVKRGMTPEERDARIERAQEAFKGGDWQAVIDECKPIKNARCYRLMGVAYSKIGDKEKTCEYFEKAGTKHPDCP